MERPRTKTRKGGKTTHPLGSPKKTSSVTTKAMKDEARRADLKRPFYFLKEDALERVRRLTGEKNFLCFCHRLQTEFNYGAGSEFWMTIESEQGKRKLVHFDRNQTCREVLLSSYNFRYEEVFAAKKDGTLRSIGAINQMAA